MLTSIIVVAYDTTRLQRWITSACLGNIARFTNRDEYELIFVDQIPPSPASGLNHRYHHIDIDKKIEIQGNIGGSAAFNLGAKEAKGEYICFMHNDVLVHEGWLEALREPLKNGYVISYPHQGASDREFIKKIYSGEITKGNDDAGITMITKEALMKTGGWDERFKTIYMDAAFRLRFPGASYCTPKCFITHIGCGTLWAWDKDQEHDAYNEEAPIWSMARDEVENKKEWKHYL